MKLQVQRRGDVKALMDAEFRVGQKAVSRAMAMAATAIKAGWRAEIIDAKLGNRLANTIRAQSYPKGRDSINAAALVYTKAPKIIAAHQAGPLIRSKDGFYLAIPTPAAGKGLRGGKISPGEWERRNGRRLRFVYRPGKPPLLVDTGDILRGARVMDRQGFGRAARGFKNRSVVIFTLVAQVRLRKRLSLFPTAEQVAFRLPGLISQNWPRS